jgi:cystathionine beta-lyase/cystathionine gamma-synthase
MPSTNIEHFSSFIRFRDEIKRSDTSEAKITPGFCRVAVGLADKKHIWKEIKMLLDDL